MRLRLSVVLLLSVCNALFLATPSAAQFTQQGPKLVGSGAIGGLARQGDSVDLSADGNTAIVGGRRDGITLGNPTGAVWIWTRSGGVWSQQGPKLVGAGAVGASAQGVSVSISADGNTAIVGGSGDNGDIGAAWIWTRTAGVWTQQGLKLVGAGAVGNSSQGLSVALSGDGNTAMVGGPGDDTNRGAVWVWTRTGVVWTQQGPKLVGSGAVGAAFQGFVALSTDGNTGIDGGPQDAAGVGATWVWTRSAGVWTQQGAKLVGSGAVGFAFQGNATSLSGDGNTASVGGWNDDGARGATWVWKRLAGVWTQQGSKLVGSGAVGNSEQGRSVPLSADANTLMAGGPGDDPAVPNSVGAVWAFVAPAPTISISNVTQAEGNGGTTNFVFDVTIANPSVSTITVDYATAPGTATAGTDYTSTSGMLTFAPMATLQQITVVVAGDLTLEANETFFVNLTNPSLGATIAVNQGLGTITNDDGADLSVTKTGPANALRGAPINYTITVSNAGPQTASSVVVTDPIPAGTTFVSATPSQGSCSGTTTVTCNLGAIAVGANATISLVVNAPMTDGPISNTATATNTPQADPTPGNNAGSAGTAIGGAANVPTLSQWALIAFAMALAAFAAVKMK